MTDRQRHCLSNGASERRRQ